MEHISQILPKALTSTSADATAGSSSANPMPPPVPPCPLCRGAGFVYPRHADGRVDYAHATACQCVVKNRHAVLTQYSNLGALAHYTFAQLAPQGRNGDKKSQERFGQAYETARKYAAKPEGWLMLAGPSGLGKTHLAAAIANERLSRGETVLFITAADLLDRLRAAFAPGSELPYDRFFEQVRNAPLLVLDDLGQQAATPWAQEKLDQLLSHRYQHELPTVITSELAPAQLDARWQSRLSNPKLVRVVVLAEAGAQDMGWSEGLRLQSAMTFANFDYRRVNLPPEQQDNLERAYRLALDFAKSPEGWLVFQGVTGAGKTHLAAAIVNYRYQAGQPALFVVVPEFLDHLRSTFSPESKTTYDQLFERVKTTPLLVLDDFGEQASTPWAQEKLYQVINYRYNAQLPTVITTSRALEELESRISSRLADRKLSTAFAIMAPDYRTDLTAGQTRRTARRNGGSR